MMRELFLTPAGAEVRIKVSEPVQVIGRDAVAVQATLLSSGGEKRIRVEIDALASLDGITAKNSPDPDVDEHPLRALAILALVDRVDSRPDFLASTDEAVVTVGPGDLDQLIRRPKASDRSIRRFVARWVYTVYSHKTLEVNVVLDRLQELLLGCTRIDLERNVGVLLAEGYLVPGDTRPLKSLRPTARLIRDVERYGAAHDDVVSERDYPASVTAHPALAEEADAILAEWARYNSARSAFELASVFRALAPIVEAVLRQVLATHGSHLANGNLGPMIGELERRRLGDRGLWSRLNHIVTFARDLAQHGEALSDPVLRIASENAFELLPQLAGLAKRD
jgi:hypothetical protein